MKLPTNPGAVVQTDLGEVFVLADRWRQLPNGESIGPDWLSEQPLVVLSDGVVIEPPFWGAVVQDANGNNWYKIQYKTVSGVNPWQSHWDSGKWYDIPKPVKVLIQGDLLLFLQSLGVEDDFEGSFVLMFLGFFGSSVVHSQSINNNN